MPREVVWLAGRGVSVSCGLTWDVPRELYEALRQGRIDRAALIGRIRADLKRAEDEALARACAETGPLERLLAALGRASRRGNWRHAFVTTNWDTLLDRALAAARLPEREDIRREALHLNGSIADPDDGAFLTEADTQDARERALEAHPGFQALLRANLCVLAGMSLRCRADKELIERLGTRQGWMPAGEHWIVLNHDAEEIAHVSRLLERQLPRSRVTAVETAFDQWIEEGMPELFGLLSAAKASTEAPRRRPDSPAW